MADIPVSLGPQDEVSTKVVITDFAWVMDENRKILVLGSSTDNHLVLVDLNDPNFRMTKLQLTNAAEPNAGRERQIEWAHETNYVWVNGGGADELHVVELPSSNIDDARVVKNIPSIGAGDIVYVENYERKAAVQMIQGHTTQALADYMPPTVDAPVAAPADTQVDASMLAEGNDDEDDDDDSDPLSVAALILSVFAVVLGALALFKASSNQTSPTNAKNGNGEETPEPPPSVS